MSDSMDDTAFDRALIAAAFALAGQEGWRRVGVAEAARRAGLPLHRARARFPVRAAILTRFGRLADQAALEGASATGAPRDRLFDLLMRRFDAMQPHREGINALLHHLPADPPLAALLSGLTLRSLGWMLEGAGIRAGGLRGCLRVQGLMAVWLYTLRAWQQDRSADLSATMAALDRALARAEQAEGWLHRPGGGAPLAPEPPMPPPPPAPEASPGASEADPRSLPPEPPAEEPSAPHPGPIPPPP